MGLLDHVVHRWNVKTQAITEDVFRVVLWTEFHMIRVNPAHQPILVADLMVDTGIDHVDVLPIFSRKLEAIERERTFHRCQRNFKKLPFKRARTLN